MASLLPLGAFTAFWCLLRGKKSGGAPAILEAGRSFLLASVLWGVAVVALSEVLSAAGLLTRTWLSGGWLLIDLVALAAVIRGNRLSSAIREIRSLSYPSRFLARSAVLAVLIVLSLLLMLAVIALPNTVDSLLYHLSRIAHWLQNGNLRPYPAVYQNQIIMPPWAELAVLQLRSLSGGDRLDNLVQWFALAGTLLIVASLTEILGKGEGRKLLAVAYTISIPMAILQATSTQTDLVTGYWVIALGFWVTVGKQRQLAGYERLAMFATLGLGMLTKITYYVYALPFLVWHFAPLLRPGRLRKLAMDALLALALSLMLNLGYWTRNVQAFGGPLGPPEFVARMAGGGLSPSTAASTALSPATESGRAMGRAASSLVKLSGAAAGLELRMMAWNMAWPIRRLQNLFEPAARSGSLQIAMGQGEYLSDSLWNHEDTAGNPVQFVLACAAIAMLAWPGNRRIKPELAHYGMAVIAGYLLLPLIVGNASSLYGVRFQLPFFIGMAPVFAEGIGRWASPRLMAGLALGMVLIGLPWVFFNNTRPMISRRPFVTRIDSVLAAPQDEIMFAMLPGLRSPYEAAAADFTQLGCQRLGLRIDSHDPEYLFWWLLAAPESGVRIEDIAPLDALRRFIDPDFRPCAIICTICGDRQELEGLQLLSSHGNVQLYGESNESGSQTNGYSFALSAGRVQAGGGPRRLLSAFPARLTGPTIPAAAPLIAH
jgi:hypothetical protein